MRVPDVSFITQIMRNDNRKHVYVWQDASVMITLDVTNASLKGNL